MRVLDKEWRFLLLMLVGGICIVIIVFWDSAPYYLWMPLVTLAVAIVFTVMNALLIALLRHERGFADRWQQTMPYMALGFLLSLLEMGSMAFMRRILGV